MSADKLSFVSLAIRHPGRDLVLGESGWWMLANQVLFWKGGRRFTRCNSNREKAPATGAYAGCYARIWGQSGYLQLKRLYSANDQVYMNHRIPAAGSPDAFKRASPHLAAPAVPAKKGHGSQNVP